MAEHQIDVTDHKALTRRATEHGPTAEVGPAVHPLLTLQSQVGNAQIARMLAQRAEDDEQIAAKHDVQRAEDDEQVAAKHDVQRADDDDQVAAKHDVQRADDDDQVAAKHDLQRADDDDQVAAKHDDGEQVGIEGGPVGPDTQSRIQAARGGGSALDGGVRTSMEASFGTSFEDVRVHHNTESDTLNRRLTAKAFTTGSDIFLRGDSSPADSRLIGHELTHVVQQRSMSGGGSMSVGAAGDPHEQHADSMGDSVASQSSAAPVAAKHEVAQREGDDEQVAAKHDVQREEDEQVAATHDPSLQREGDDEDIA